MGMSVHYKIPRRSFFDTEGEVTPAKWYLSNRKECGQMFLSTKVLSTCANLIANAICNSSAPAPAIMAWMWAR